MLLGWVMDLNYLTWILVIALEKQKPLHHTKSSVPSYFELRAAMQGPSHLRANDEVVRGKEW